MKVAYVVSLFPKISETFIVREMEALRARGVEIVVVSLKSRREPIAHAAASPFLPVTLDAPPADRALAAFLLRFWRQPVVTARILAAVVAAHASRPLLLARALPLVAVAAAVADDLRDRSVNRVHAHWATWPALVAWAIRRFEGIPYSLTAHAHDIFLPNPLLAAKIRESDFTVTISDHNRAHLRRVAGERAARKVAVVHCGVPLGEFPPRPEPPLRPPGEPARLVSIGRLVDYKGFPDLVRAVGLLAERGRPVACDIVGEGPEEGRIRAEIRARGLEGAVRLLGARKEDEVREALRGADACVLACRPGADGQMDGIPVVLMEAMALGVPVVATRLSGIPELVEDGVTGLLAAPGEPAGVADAVERLLADPALGARLAAEGRRRVEASFDVASTAGRLHELLEGKGRPS